MASIQNYLTLKFVLHTMQFYSSFFYVTLFLKAQDPRLAQQYFNDGDYEKQQAFVSVHVSKNPGNDNFFSRYLDCLMLLKRYEE